MTTDIHRHTHMYNIYIRVWNFSDPINFLMYVVSHIQLIRKSYFYLKNINLCTLQEVRTLRLATICSEFGKSWIPKKKL